MIYSTWDAAVTDVRGPGEVASHTLEGDVLAVGPRVRRTLDAKRRYVLTRIHTALRRGAGNLTVRGV